MTLEDELNEKYTEQTKFETGNPKDTRHPVLHFMKWDKDLGVGVRYILVHTQ